MNLFDFLRAEWPEVYESAHKAAMAVYPDPRTACSYARRALELVVAWMFKLDPALRLPYLRQSEVRCGDAKGRLSFAPGTRLHPKVNPYTTLACVRAPSLQQTTSTH